MVYDFLFDRCQNTLVYFFIVKKQPIYEKNKKKISHETYKWNMFLEQLFSYGGRYSWKAEIRILFFHNIIIIIIIKIQMFIIICHWWMSFIIPKFGQLKFNYPIKKHWLFIFSTIDKIIQIKQLICTWIHE